QPALIDTALFTVFAAHHSLFARDPIKRRLRAIPASLLRSVHRWCASLLLILVCVAWQPTGGTLYEIAGAGRIAFAVVQLGGIWLIARSVAKLDPLDLAGIHPPSEASPLQIEGPYRLVRHPLYLGWMF